LTHYMLDLVNEVTLQNQDHIYVIRSIFMHFIYLRFLYNIKLLPVKSKDFSTTFFE